MARSIQSLVSEAQRHEPEVRSILCVDPVETAADKLSALAWRVCTRDYGAEDDDPTIVRHLHDLAALESHIQGSEAFRELVRKAVGADAQRGGGKSPSGQAERFALMLDRLMRERFWAEDYTMPEHLERLRVRSLGGKRSLAIREFALGIEALERFVRREPLRRVHECAFGVLALESEPVDPRL